MTLISNEWLKTSSNIKIAKGNKQMNSNEYTQETLVIGVLIAVGIVLVGIVVMNLPEILHIIATEGLLSE